MAEFTRVIFKEHQALLTEVETLKNRVSALEKEIEAINVKLVRIPIDHSQKELNETN